MKKSVTLILFLLATLYVSAQTPTQIVSRMEDAIENNKEDGIHMVMDLKIPIVGTFTTSLYRKGNKSRLEVMVADSLIITWSDGATIWIYTSPTNEVTISNSKNHSDDATSTDRNAEMFSNILGGYNVSLSKETPKEWHLTCKRSKANKNKEAPKKMDLVVEKGTYRAVSLSTSKQGFSITMHDVVFGVSDEQVTFNAADFPGVIVKDER